MEKWKIQVYTKNYKIEQIMSYDHDYIYIRYIS